MVGVTRSEHMTKHVMTFLITTIFMVGLGLLVLWCCQVAMPLLSLNGDTLHSWPVLVFSWPCRDSRLFASDFTIIRRFVLLSHLLVTWPDLPWWGGGGGGWDGICSWHPTAATTHRQASSTWWKRLMALKQLFYCIPKPCNAVTQVWLWVSFASSECRG